MEESTNSDHCKPSIDKFSGTILLECLIGLGQTERIERELAWSTRRAEGHHLNECGDTNDNLPSGGPQKELLKRSLRDPPIMNGGRQLRSALIERKSVEFIDEDSQNCQHTNTSMLDFGLLQKLDIEKVGESKGVKASVSGHVWCKSRWLLQKWNGWRHLHAYTTARSSAGTHVRAACGGSGKDGTPWGQSDR